MSELYTIKEALHGYTTEALGAMCSAWGLSAQSKPARIRAVERALEDEEAVAQCLAERSPEAIRLLNLIADRDEMSTADILGCPGVFARKEPERAMDEVARYALALATPQERSGAFSFSQLRDQRYGRESMPSLFVPSLVRRHVPSSPPMGVEIPPSDECFDETTQGGTDQVTTIILETLRIIDVLSPRVTAASDIHKTDEAKAHQLIREVGQPSDGFDLALMVMRELGCIGVSNGRLQTTHMAEIWAQQARSDRARDVFRAFLQSQDLADLKIFFPQVYEALESRLPKDSLRRTYHRAIVAQVLREQEEMTWYPLEGLVNVLRQLDGNVLFAEERWRAAHQSSGAAGVAWKSQQWRDHERRLYKWMIRLFFRELEMVELTSDGAHFRLTPLGMYALGVKGSPPPEPESDGEDVLTIQPDFEIIAYLDRCSADFRRKLDTFCERIRSGAVSTYRLTQDSVYRGIRTGVTLQNFIEQVEKHARHEIPRNVRDQFGVWQRKLENIVLYSRCNIIECKTAEEAGNVLAQCNGARLIGDRYILLKGPAPKAGSKIDYSKKRPSVLQQDAGLQMRVPWPECGLFARRRLAGLGELSQDEQGDLIIQLSREKIQNVKDWSMAVAQLETMAGEPLAPRYRTALRAWAGDLDSAGSRTATLVRFSDPETSEAVMEFEDAAAHVEGRLGLYTLVIRQGELTQFKKKLREHGIVIEPTEAVADETGPEDWAVRWVEDHHLKQTAKAPEKAVKEEKEAPASDYGATLPSYPARVMREIIETAIQKRKPLLIEYQSLWSERPTVRRVDPVSLDMSSSSPTLSGYCHLREGARSFRLARIIGIRTLEDESY